MQPAPIALAVLALALALAPPASARDDAPALDQYVPSVPEPGRERDLSPAVRLPAQPGADDAVQAPAEPQPGQPAGQAPATSGGDGGEPPLTAPGLDPPVAEPGTLPAAADPGLASAVAGSIGGSDGAGPLLVIAALAAVSGWAVAAHARRRRGQR